MPASWRSKIAFKDIGNAKKIAAMSDDDLKPTKGRFIIGYLFGKVNGFVERTDPKTDEKFEGLRGVFGTLPSDPESMEEIESGVLFMPDSFHNVIADAFRSGALKTGNNGQPNPAYSLEFSFEVAAIKAQNPAGYSWDIKPAREFSGEHPLKDLKADIVKLAASRPKQIAHVRK